MKRKILLFSVFFLLPAFIFAQFPSSVTVIQSAPNKTVQIKGNLSNGKIMSDLSWASKSSVACFPGTQNKKFRGNHVLYGTTIPPHSEMFVTIIPNDRNANFSLYGYQVGANSFPLVPNLSSCLSCEADHKWDYPKRGKTQDHTRTIRFNAIGNPYNIFIGVAGSEGLIKGGYTLKIKMKTKVSNNSEQKALKMYTAKSERNKTMSYSGNLAEGVKINDLSWASKSSVACFPATQNKKFNGNHIIYITEIPARSYMEIKVIPKNKKANMSLYAYTVGTSSTAMVPNLSSCVTCEADHKWDYPKRGKTQNHTRSVKLNSINNPYKVVIGVAGANGLTQGDFIIQIKVTDR